MNQIKALLYKVDGEVEEVEYYVGLPHLRSLLKCTHCDYIDCIAGFRMYYDDDFLAECTPEMYIKYFNVTASTFVKHMSTRYFTEEFPLRLFGACLLVRYDDINDVYVDHDLHKNLWNGCFYDKDDLIN